MKAEKCDYREELKGNYNIIPLSLLKDGQESVVVKIQAGRGAHTRLCHLGILPGTRIKKLQGAPFKGPVKIEVRDTTLALGFGLASKILVDGGKVRE
ncbi:MAG: FeoA family protein [Promethearchaeota archaeon]